MADREQTMSQLALTQCLRHSALPSKMFARASACADECSIDTRSTIVTYMEQVAVLFDTVGVALNQFVGNTTTLLVNSLKTEKLFLAQQQAQQAIEQLHQRSSCYPNHHDSSSRTKLKAVYARGVFLAS